MDIQQRERGAPATRYVVRSVVPLQKRGGKKKHAKTGRPKKRSYATCRVKTQKGHYAVRRLGGYVISMQC